jgi:hypothetical protein
VRPTIADFGSALRFVPHAAGTSSDGPAAPPPDRERGHDKGVPMSLGTILLIVLILALIGALPSWPYSTGWGYAPSGIVGAIVLVILILVLMGRL